MVVNFPCFTPSGETLDLRPTSTQASIKLGSVVDACDAKMHKALKRPNFRLKENCLNSKRNFDICDIQVLQTVTF